MSPIESWIPIGVLLVGIVGLLFQFQKNIIRSMDRAVAMESRMKAIEVRLEILMMSCPNCGIKRQAISSPE